MNSASVSFSPIAPFPGCKKETSDINNFVVVTGYGALRVPGEEEVSKVAEDRNHVILKEIQAKMNRKLKESEIAVLEHWKGHLDRILSMKPEGVAALQLQVRKVSEMMNNRIGILKRD